MVHRAIGQFPGRTTFQHAARFRIRSCVDSVGEAKNLALIDCLDMERPLVTQRFKLLSEHMDVVQCLSERRGG